MTCHISLQQLTLWALKGNLAERMDVPDCEVQHLRLSLSSRKLLFCVPEGQIRLTNIFVRQVCFQVPVPPLQFWLGRKQESISDMDMLISVYPSTSVYLSWGVFRKPLYFMATICRSNLQGDLDSLCSLGSRFVYLGAAVCLFLWQSHHLKDHLSW